ncbi:MAG: hypothetical protein DLM61_13055 [Pseudonocardiales bacterium]|nr:MAG: hypothetical protein DLM61_13055 [Pseudonocardiales bacterium]
MPIVTWELVSVNRGVAASAFPGDFPSSNPYTETATARTTTAAASPARYAFEEQSNEESR